MIPISLYIHFPWCIQKCPYCDFNSHALKQNIPEEVYVQRLIQDFEESLELLQGREIHSIFMGGGTPSLFSPAAISYLLNEIQRRAKLKPQAEISLEANPGTVDESRFKGFFEAGINRLSIGVQSFNANHLKTLGRIHDGERAKLAIEAAQNAGFKNFNIDLMHGLPQQSLEEAISDLQTALSFAPPHLSWYQLTIEPNTVFHKTRPTLPVDDILADIQEAGENLLAQNGFEHYEISAFAKPGHESQHNLNYWQFGDYLGIGAGAHGKVTYPVATISLEKENHFQSSATIDSQMPQNNILINICRINKTRQPKDYLDLQKNMVAGKEIIAAERLPFEFMMNAMRLNRVIKRELFEARTHLTWESLTPYLTQAAAKNLIVYDHDQIIVTEIGRRFLNDLLEIFLAF
ncbi:MAG: hemN [Gammaproteobacteria bacterium]|jgi:oxygen-independent coproporphyrinogen-3 oxidase|nr:hemN [Gammaproteobacteria bacterium]